MNKFKVTAWAFTGGPKFHNFGINNNKPIKIISNSPVECAWEVFNNNKQMQEFLELNDDKHITIQVQGPHRTWLFNFKLHEIVTHRLIGVYHNKTGETVEGWRMMT